MQMLTTNFSAYNFEEINCLKTSNYLNNQLPKLKIMLCSNYNKLIIII